MQAKAKEAPGYRFYLLYDKLYRKDVLGYAYRRCKANKGAPGVDREDFASIEAYDEERWLGELADTLRKKTYRAEAVRRVWIPKADGKKLRPLGIPCVADRVVMTAATVPHGLEVVLDYCAAVRGILNDSQGGPLRPPGLRMSEALGEVRQSLQRNLRLKKGGARKRCWNDWVECARKPPRDLDTPRITPVSCVA